MLMASMVFFNERTYKMLPITDWFDETAKFEDSFAVIEVTRKRTLKKQNRDRNFLLHHVFKRKR